MKVANSKRKCRCCPERGRPEDGVTINGAYYIDMDHVLAYSKRNIQKGRKLREKAHRAERKQHKRESREIKSKNYSYQFDLTKKAAQKLANRLDAHLGCICCDAPRGSAQFCGGHAKSAGAHPEMALDLRNIHGQRNSLCNKHKSGNWSGDKHSRGYRQGLIDRYGQALVDYLESYHPPAKRTCEELEALRKVYYAEIRRLESGLPPSRDWRAP